MSKEILLMYRRTDSQPPPRAWKVSYHTTLCEVMEIYLMGSELYWVTYAIEEIMTYVLYNSIAFILMVRCFGLLAWAWNHIRHSSRITWQLAFSSYFLLQLLIAYLQSRSQEERRNRLAKLLLVCCWNYKKKYWNIHSLKRENFYNT